MTTNLRAASARIGLAAALAAFAAAPALADKVYLKNGKVLDGIIQEEHPDNVHLLYQGKLTKVPRVRIDRIEKEEGGANAEMLMQKIEEALKVGDAESAEKFLDEAIKLDGPDGPRKDKLAELEQKIVKLRQMGSPGERRKMAEKFVKDATDLFDKIENQKGLALLLKALEADPDFQPAHELMNQFMRSNNTSFTSNPNYRNMARDYFSEQVDVSALKSDSAIFDLLPLLFEEENKELKKAQDPAELATHIRRMRKMSEAFDKAGTVRNANDAQKELIAKRASGVVTEQVEEGLKEGKYEGAFQLLQAYGSPEEAPELADLYTRAYIGVQQFDKAKALMEAGKATAKDPDKVDKAINALGLYATAVEAMNAGNSKDARSLLSRLFSLKDELYPEIYALVAQAKVGYDITEMEALDGAGDADNAAAVAVRIFQYAPAGDKNSRKAAEDMFNKLAPSLSYKPVLVWSVDGVKIPTPPEWSALAGDYLKSQFAALKFNETSPFTLQVHLEMKSLDNAGARVLEGVSKPQAFEIDQLEPDTAISGLRVSVTVDHAERARIYVVEEEMAGLPEQVRKERELRGDMTHQTGAFIYLTLTQLRDFFTFIERDFIYYVPRSVEAIPTAMKLK